LLLASWFGDALGDSRLVRAECEAATLPLLSSVFPEVRFSAAGSLKPADVIEDRIQLCASLSDLAAAYARTPAGGWLPFDASAAAARRARIQTDPGKPRILGLAWQPTGSALGGLEPFAPLFEVPGITWLALPMGNVAPALAQFLAQSDCPLTFEPGWSRDGLASIAGSLAALDLMISSEDVAATLAGALGQPVWKIAGVNAHWSWGAAGETSKWHPTARIFRRPLGGELPVDSIRNGLAQFAGA
jgi:hypothetical protein